MAIIYQASVKALCERVAGRLVERLQQGKVPWQRPFKGAAAALPFNVVRAVREKKPQPYSGINRFLLQFFMWEEGWPSPAFLTMKQLQELNPTRDPDGPRLRHVDGKVPLSPADWKAHGQQACNVIVFKERVRPGDDGEEERSFFGRTYQVFNVAQIENLPADLAAAAGTAEGSFKPECVPAEIMSAIDAMGLAGGIITHVQPHYSPVRDQIGMPPIGAFVSEDAFLATLLHEAGHAAGAAGRVGREPRGEKREERIAAYAREELCAELTSAFAMAAFGLPPSQELQHVGYLQSYIDLLKAEPSVLVWTASQAERRTSFLVEKARERASLSAVAAE